MANTRARCTGDAGQIWSCGLGASGKAGQIAKYTVGILASPDRAMACTAYDEIRINVS